MIRRTSQLDSTLEREHIKRYKELFSEYEQIKRKEHPEFTLVKYFWQARQIDKRLFHKVYGRYKTSGEKETAILPQRRGPRYSTRRPDVNVEQKIIEYRSRGTNRYEIAEMLRQEKGVTVISASGVYNVLRRHGLNRLKKRDKEEKRKIIKERMGQLGHIDIHYLSKYVIRGTVQKLYVVAVVDDYTRLAWAELIDRIDSLTVMFSVMRCFMELKKLYGIQFEEVITDNGKEFGGVNLKHKEKHPFERMLIEMEVKHRYTQFYRPQTNGKIERFWRTMEEDLIIDTDFDSEEELKEELLKYVFYYNEHRPHQGIEGKKPIEMIKRTD